MAGFAFKSTKTLRWALGLSLGVNLLVLGLVAGAVYRFDGPHGGAMRHMRDYGTPYVMALPEERRRAELEAAERARLEAETKNLEQYRSEFFGRLRALLGNQEGVRIEGDRFVFSSEVLFPPGAATLSADGRGEIAKVAGILRNIAADIPPEIDWVIRVDGHTDNQPLSGLGEFADNWELSQARALSVVKYMINFLGIAPERLAANGFGQYQPVASGNTEAARAQNRRIELKLTER